MNGRHSAAVVRQQQHLPTPLDHDPTEPGLPRVPRGDVPSGHIWPPVAGRVILHGATSMASSLFAHRDGGWDAKGPAPWRIVSRAAHSFSDLDGARRALVAWARWHSDLADSLSSPRCLVLAPCGAATWRIWQIVQRERSLLDEAGDALITDDPRRIAHRLLAVAHRYLDATALLVACSESISLDDVSASELAPVFIGLAAPKAAGSTAAGSMAVAPSLSQRADALPGHELVRHAFAQLFTHDIHPRALNVGEVLRELQARAAIVKLERVGETIAAMLIGH